MTTTVVEVSSPVYVIEVVNNPASVIENTTNYVIVEASQDFQVIETSTFSFEVNQSVSSADITAPATTFSIESPVIQTQVITEVQSVATVSLMEEELLKKRIDFISDSLLYKGEAAPDAIVSNPVWRIRKITIAGDGDVTEDWADGVATFTKVWNNRLSYSY